MSTWTDVVIQSHACAGFFSQSCDSSHILLEGSMQEGQMRVVMRRQEWILNFQTPLTPNPKSS